MKTVVIYDQCGQEDLKFFIAEGDFSELNNKYINCTDTSDEDADKINNLLGYKDDGSGELIDLLSEFPVQAVIDGAKVITVGFFP